MAIIKSLIASHTWPCAGCLISMQAGVTWAQLAESRHHGRAAAPVLSRCCSRGPAAVAARIRGTQILPARTVHHTPPGKGATPRRRHLHASVQGLLGLNVLRHGFRRGMKFALCCCSVWQQCDCAIIHNFAPALLPCSAPARLDSSSCCSAWCGLRWSGRAGCRRAASWALAAVWASSPALSGTTYQATD